MAVRNLAARVPENRKALVDCQVEHVIHEALRNFGSDAALKDVAKAALRDLQLEVKLEEQWKGPGIQMSNKSTSLHILIPTSVFSYNN